MLSEHEKHELKDMAASPTVREEFRRLRAASQQGPVDPVPLDRVVNFLTTMSRLAPSPIPRRPFIAYSRVLL